MRVTHFKRSTGHTEGEQIMLESMLRGYLEKVEEIRTQFTDTDGTGWSPKDLKNYVDSIDEETAKQLLRHFIVAEWMRKIEIERDEVNDKRSEILHRQKRE